MPLLLLLAAAWPVAVRAQEAAVSYAGSESCEACHQDIYTGFRRNAHAALDRDQKSGWAARACEACHGPGAKHLESMDAATIRNPAKMAPMVADKNCLGCHLNQPSQAGRIRGGHARNQVACVSCHKVHAAAEAAPRPHFNARINAQCAACHPASLASFQRPHAHRLPQGAMSCVDCHNPHGSFLPRNMQTVSANEPGCLKCHGDKRGPFVFEHAPVRLEGCEACHEPHGSANPRMLARHEVSNLCLECHANIYSPAGASASGTLGGIPPGLHDLANPRFRNCTLCHVKIHGSQANRDFLR